MMAGNIFKKIFSKKMLITLAMGFSSGLPLLLTMGTLQAWMHDEGVSLGKIGLITLVGMPYTWKFFWAPFLDRFTLPFLGRRRGWLIVTQVLLMVSICAIGFNDPASSLTPLAVTACLVAIFSATQDMVIDAYRREHLSDDELAMGSAVYVYGYRIAMNGVASSGALILADHFPWRVVYIVMGLLMVIGIITTLLAPEPKIDFPAPKSFYKSVTLPFKEFFSRNGAIGILAFITLYKVGDSMASAMTMPFYLEVGFTKTQIGAIVKGAGLAAVLGGMALGGAFIIRYKLGLSLWIFGVLQSVSTAGFALLTIFGPSIPILTGVIAFENLSGGMGTAAIIAYMALQTNKRFTATQYALLTALAGLPRTMLSSPTGYLVEYIGWNDFFIFCALIAIPGMLLLFKVAPRSKWKELDGNTTT